MTRVWRLAILVVLASSLSACALFADPGAHQDRAAVGAGRTLAETRCGSCHALQGGQPSPNPTAPPFAVVAKRYSGLRVDWELEAITQVGHYQMPVRVLSAPEIAALSAYIRSLDR